MAFTHIRTIDATLSLLELEAFRATTLVLKPDNDRILVELVSLFQS
jgi:hypothetical protein